MRFAKYVVVVSFAAAGFALAAAAIAAAVQIGPYAGRTSQAGSTVSFTVANGGGSVDAFKADMSATCTKDSASQEVDVSLTPTPSMKVHQGDFSFSGGFVFHNGPTVIGHGKGKVNGTFTSDRQVAGTLRFPWSFFQNAGLLSGYQCDTGKVTFQASLESDTPPAARCLVPKVKGKRLKAAKRAIRRANCRVGRVVKRHSKARPRRVFKQRPRAGADRAAGARVKLVVSRGPAR